MSAARGRLYAEREWYRVLSALQEVFEFISRSLARLLRFSREAYVARSVSTTFHKVVTARSRSHERIASCHIETHGFLRNSRDAVDLFQARHLYERRPG